MPSDQMPTERPVPVVEVQDATKHFGPTRALDAASVSVDAGEMVGIVGHNGAGKSTLLRALAGLVPLDRGVIRLDGQPVTGPASARALGVRIVHQEQSLCSSLRVDETAAVAERSYGGLRWRARAKSAIIAALDEIFPAHGLEGWQRIADLTVTQRQMVEIATLALGRGESRSPTARLLVLDEPTSSLDAEAARRLYGWLRDAADAGVAVLVTTHRLQEMLDHLDRLYVMRDGRVVAEESTRGLRRDTLVQLVGGSPAGGRAASGPEPALSGPEPARHRDPAAGGLGVSPPRIVVDRLRTPDLDDVSLEVHPGELVGLAGLEGHGQRRLLGALFDEANQRWRRARIKVDGRVAFVTGDRTAQGIFGYWTAGQNVTISSLGRICRGGVISPSAERRVVERWTGQLDIRGDERQPITTLSGGNQQKVLIARAVATAADVLLLDDPTRGVDQTTKEEIYRILRRQADQGTAVIWYSTENEELLRCDRLFVLRRGRLVRTLVGEEVDEQHLVGASFGSISDESTTSRPAVSGGGRVEANPR